MKQTNLKPHTEEELNKIERALYMLHDAETLLMEAGTQGFGDAFGDLEDAHDAINYQLMIETGEIEDED